jgi:DNA-binding MarR family transcriptional regulator
MERHTIPKDILSQIPLNDIVQDWRVQEYIRKKAREMARKHIDTYTDRFNQIQSCHAWLLCLHYRAINLLQEKYSLSKPEFMVLMGAYFFKSKHQNGFKAKELSSTLLSWQYNRVYRHLIKLSQKGYIRKERGTYYNSHRYWLCAEGEAVIRAFNQHFGRVFREVREKIGEFPDPSFY